MNLVAGTRVAIMIDPFTLISEDILLAAALLDDPGPRPAPRKRWYGRILGHGYTTTRWFVYLVAIEGSPWKLLIPPAHLLYLLPSGGSGTPAAEPGGRNGE